MATARGHRHALSHQLANQAHELSSVLQLIVSGSLPRLSRIAVSRIAVIRRLLQSRADESLPRLQTTSLATTLVHCRDVVTRLASAQAASPADFAWESQVRLVWERSENAPSSLRALCCDATLEYGYEYLGCQSRLVVTPLTDRCRITLCQVRACDTAPGLHARAGGLTRCHAPTAGAALVHGWRTSRASGHRQDRNHQGLGSRGRPPGVRVQLQRADES